MKLDLPTLAFILSLTCITQVIALYIQYRVNRTYLGIGWWLLGSLAMAMGFITLSVTPLKTIGILSMFGCPLLVWGRISVFIGTRRFFGQEVHKKLFYSLFCGCTAVYYYFLFVRPNLTWRILVVEMPVAVFSLLIARLLITNGKKGYFTASRFTAGIFLLSALNLVIIMAYTWVSKTIYSYQQFAPIQTMIFVVPTVTSSLWTIGLILTVNQRLIMDNREEKENLRRLFNLSPDAALIIRLDDGALVDANQAFLNLTGYAWGEINGESAGSVNLWRHSKDHRAFMATMREQGMCDNLEMVSQHKDGTEFIGMVSARIITIHGRPHIISVTRDITERRKAEREKAELAEKYQQLKKAESLGRMAGAIAHHFNNHMQSVMSNLELLGHFSQDAESRPFLARAKQATERASEMSTLMLVYLGQTSSQQQAWDLAELCRNGLAILQAQLPATVTLQADCPGPGPFVRVNAAQMQQVLINLGTNALEALPPAGGRIRLSLQPVPATAIAAVNRVPINWQPQVPEYACLEVMDDGCGIPEADIEKLFDPFFSTKFTGRGLGLPVVLGIVQAHGGAITLTSAPDRGSVFRIHLPLCEAGPQAG